MFLLTSTIYISRCWWPLTASFSDLMSVLALVFILVMFYILYKYFIINSAYEEKLQEMLTIKSDDVVGRVKAFESIVKGQNIPAPGIPEAFRVMVKELQSLGLDVKILDKDNEEIDIKQTYDEDENMPMASDYYDESDVAVDSEIEDNYTMENPDEDSDSYDDADFDGSEDEDDDGFDF